MTMHLTREQRQVLGTILARQKVATLFGDAAEAREARAISAGVVFTVHALLAPELFHNFCIHNEIDPPELAYLLELAKGQPEPEPEAEPEPNQPIIDLEP